MPKGSREFYQLRKYILRTGAQPALVQTFLEHALIPALNRLSISPVGAFKVDVGPETPTYFVLIPATSAELLVTLDEALARDAEFVRASTPFREAPAAAPAFVRVESWIFSAFAGWPKLTAPKRDKRIFQLRTYESASYAAHVRKVQMFNEAELPIFTRVGLKPVFFGETLVGSGMPSLTYMLSFADAAQLAETWSAFSADPAWKELSHQPQNVDAELVSNISNLHLSPLPFSQI